MPLYGVPVHTVCTIHYRLLFSQWTSTYLCPLSTGCPVLRPVICGDRPPGLQRAVRVSRAPLTGHLPLGCDAGVFSCRRGCDAPREERALPRNADAFCHQYLLLLVA